jgi:hypothetical protein
MAGDPPFSEEDRADSGPGSPSWEPYQPPQESGGSGFYFLRRYAFSITAVTAALAIGALIYFAPIRLAPEEPLPRPAERTQPPSLSVYSQPSGASVIVGADTIGVTPVQNHRLSSGTYLVTVDRADYGSRDTVVTLSAGQSAVLRPRLRPENALAGTRPLSESSFSAGGDENSAQPTSPERQSAPPSSPPQTGSSNPTPDPDQSPASQEPRDASPAPPPENDTPTLVTGTLTLRSEPGSTAVTLNGYDVGTTPATLDEVAAGTHDVTFSRPGYETVTRRVEVTGNETVTVTASLKRQTGVLRVLARPWGSIYIDTQRRAENSDVWYETTLPTGPHTVTARHPVLGEQSRSVTVAARDTQSVVLDLREE